MSRYQKHTIPATLQVKNALRTCAVIVCAMAVFLWADGDSYATTLRQQVPEGHFPILYVTPLDSVGVELPTHSVDLQLDSGQGEGGQDGVSATMVARYRLRNPSREAVTLRLRIGSGHQAIASGSPVPQLTIRDQPLALEALDDGNFDTQVTLGADEQAELKLSYSASLDGSRLPTLIYDTSNLFGWPGRLSLRISIRMPNDFDSESWVELSPREWDYSPTSSAQQTIVKWLYEADWPSAPIVFRFVHPTTWQNVQSLEAAARPDAGPAAYGAVGELYLDLYTESTVVYDPVDSNSGSPSRAAQRFYAQALATYTDGIEVGRDTSATPPELASLYAGLARLYRSRITDRAGVTDEQYARLMIGAVTEALAGLNPDSPQTNELAQWYAEGLHQLLAVARARGDRPQVMQLLEKMAQTPSIQVDPVEIAEEKRIASVQQALQLLQRGNQEAATAIAGPEIVAAALAPQTSLPLVSGWQVTVTITPESTVAIFVAAVASDGAERARTAFQTRMRPWQDSADGNVDVEEESAANGRSFWHIEFVLPTRDDALALAATLPPSPDWALMPRCSTTGGSSASRPLRLTQRATCRLPRATICLRWQRYGRLKQIGLCNRLSGSTHRVA